MDKVTKAQHPSFENLKFERNPMRIITKVINPEQLYTMAEFDVIYLPDDSNKYELINGQIRQSPANRYEEGKIVSSLIRRIFKHDQEEILGKSWAATQFQVLQGFVPAPDLAFVIAANIPPVSQGAVKVRPDLVMEIWSPGEVVTKFRLAEAKSRIRGYQIAGVKIVWAINPSYKTVEVYHPGQASPVQILGIEGELSGEDVIPGFTIPVKALFN